MIEKKEQTEIRKEETTVDNGDGDKPKTPTLYEQTNTATERLENANTKTEELLNRQEEIYERQKLSGGTEAGTPAEEPKEETPEEYARKIYPSGFNKPAPTQDVKR